MLKCSKSKGVLPKGRGQFIWLVTWASENVKMFEEQGGFTKGKGTIYQFLSYSPWSASIYAEKMVDVTIFFKDFSKACNKIPHLHVS